MYWGIMEIQCTITNNQNTLDLFYVFNEFYK